jgi:hypothetical protein
LSAFCGAIDARIIDAPIIDSFIQEALIHACCAAIAGTGESAPKQ